MSSQNNRKFLGYVVLILILIVLLSCKISLSGQDNSDDFSTSAAQTIDAGNAQLTIQAQQVQLTSFARTLSVPAVPPTILTSPQPEPIQSTQLSNPEPTFTVAVQSPSQQPRQP